MSFNNGKTMVLSSNPVKVNCDAKEEIGTRKITAGNKLFYLVGNLSTNTINSDDSIDSFELFI